MTWLVMTPFRTTLIFPCQDSFCFLQGGCDRPGGGLDFLKSPLNVWSTFGTYPTIEVAIESPLLTICSGY